MAFADKVFRNMQLRRFFREPKLNTNDINMNSECMKLWDFEVHTMVK